MIIVLLAWIYYIIYYTTESDTVENVMLKVISGFLIFIMCI